MVMAQGRRAHLSSIIKASNGLVICEKFGRRLELQYLHPGCNGMAIRWFVHIGVLRFVDVVRSESLRKSIGESGIFEIEVNII